VTIGVARHARIGPIRGTRPLARQALRREARRSRVDIRGGRESLVVTSAATL
jgi:hypothetical protein